MEVHNYISCMDTAYVRENPHQKFRTSILGTWFFLVTPPFFKDKNSCSAADNDFNDIHSDRFRRVSAAYEKCCAYFKEAGVQWGKIVDHVWEILTWCRNWVKKWNSSPLTVQSMVFSYMWVHKVEIPAKRVQPQHLMVKTSHWLEHLTQHHTHHNYNCSIQP